MTHRLYYTDPYLRSFDAVVADVQKRGDRLAIKLDQTAFYPTTGGQPFDTGTLGGFSVVDVIDEEDGEITHVVDPGPTNDQGPRTDQGPGTDQGLRTLDKGQTVACVVDWPRRFDHMQQHTGQHVLSAAIQRLLNVRTVSFHLGADVSTIDVARELTAAELTAVETEANRVVWENRPVSIRFASAEEAAKLPLRKEPLRDGTLRLIDVDDFDLSACGGTHVTRTGAIGVIAVASWERFKGGQRVEFLCGGRALRRLRTLRDSVAAAGRQLSVLPEALPASIERLLADAKEQKRSMTALQGEIARYRADEIAATAESAGPVRLVIRQIDGDANALKILATSIAAKPGLVVVLVSASRPALVVTARSADVTVSAQKLLAALIELFGGRGGGRPELAQGGGLDADADTILAAAREAVSKLL